MNYVLVEVFAPEDGHVLPGITMTQVATFEDGQRLGRAGESAYWYVTEARDGATD